MLCEVKYSYISNILVYIPDEGGWASICGGVGVSGHPILLLKDLVDRGWFALINVLKTGTV